MDEVVPPSVLPLPRVRTARADVWFVAVTALRTQLRMTRHNIEDLMPVLTIPLLTLVSLAIFVQAGRADLADRALVASLLMTLGQMGLFVGSEVVARDRTQQTLELAVAAPGSYFVVLATRIFMLTLLGVLGFLEGWLIARLCFGVQVRLAHPLLFTTAVLATTLATTGTCLITAAFTSLLPNARTLQHALNGPFYLLGGVLVPVTLLPDWVQPLTRINYFYWSANLLRAAMRPEPPEQVALSLLAILALGLASAGLGLWLLQRAFQHLRRHGTLGLT